VEPLTSKALSPTTSLGTTPAQLYPTRRYSKSTWPDKAGQLSSAQLTEQHLLSPPKSEVRSSPQFEFEPTGRRTLDRDLDWTELGGPDLTTRAWALF